MPSNYLTIQSSLNVQNCIKCGKRPVIEQRGKFWAVLCKNPNCDNEVAGKYVNFEAWDAQNKK